MKLTVKPAAFRPALHRQVPRRGAEESQFKSRLDVDLGGRQWAAGQLQGHRHYADDPNAGKQLRTAARGRAGQAAEHGRDVNSRPSSASTT